MHIRGACNNSLLSGELFARLGLGSVRTAHPAPGWQCSLSVLTQVLQQSEARFGICDGCKAKSGREENTNFKNPPSAT